MGGLGNVGMSSVFLALASGMKTGKEIASSLDISAPAVIQQIHRLEGLGLVLKGPKQGKFTPYELDWVQVAVLTARNLPAFKSQLDDVAEDPSLTIEEKQKILHRSERLGQNHAFVRFVQRYFAQAGQYYFKEQGQRIPSLARLIQEMDTAIRGLYLEISEMPETVEADELVRLFREIQGEPPYTTPQMAWIIEGLEAVGFRTPDYDSLKPGSSYTVVHYFPKWLAPGFDETTELRRQVEGEST